MIKQCFIVKLNSDINIDILKILISSDYESIFLYLLFTN